MKKIVPFPVIPLSRIKPTKLRERGLKGFGKSNHLLAARRARTFDRHSQFAQPWQRLDGVRNPRQSVLGQIPSKRNWVNEHGVVHMELRFTHNWTMLVEDAKAAFDMLAMRLLLRYLLVMMEMGISSCQARTREGRH